MINLSKNILYEDEDIVALDKPAGLVVHPDGRTIEESVSEWFGKKYPESKNVGEPIRIKNKELRVTNDDSIHNSKFVIQNSISRPGIVHRIDRDTSGVLLLAKTKEGHQCLKEQFQKREIEKIYHLFVYGNIKDNQGTIDLPIARSASNFRKRSAERGARGEKREAVTYFKVLKRFDGGQASVTFVEAKPKTGRTHQIRVHFKALHHPVVCDKLYGGRRSLGEGGCALGFNRLALHARSITFKTVGSKTVTVEAPYPEDFAKAVDIIG